MSAPVPLKAWFPLESENAKRAFKLVDRDEDGFVGKEDLKESPLTKCSDERACEILKVFDLNKDGKLGQEEFANWYWDEYKKRQYKEDLLRTFEFLDIDDDGFVEKEDLQHVTCLRNCPPRLFLRGLCEEEASEIMRMFDVDRDGKLSQEEFANWYREVVKTELESEMREKFDELDLNGDGFLSSTELRILVTKCFEHLHREKWSNWPTEVQFQVQDEIDKVVAKIIKTGDTDGDVKIIFEEFLKVMPK